MTRKHYEAVAAVIRARRERHREGDAVSGALGNVARDLADVFAADNPRFDRGRFLAACGIGE